MITVVREGDGGFSIIVPAGDVAEFMLWVNDEHGKLDTPLGKRMMHLQDDYDPR